jgi:hypothetical protein
MKMKEFTRRAEAAKAKARRAIYRPKEAVPSPARPTGARASNYAKPMAETPADRLMRDLQKDVARGQVARTAPGIMGVVKPPARARTRTRRKI